MKSPAARVSACTLYRHFPTRDAILAFVYRREVEQLAASATRLLETMPPSVARAAWMRLCIDYIGTKKVIASALSAIVGCVGLYAASGPPIIGAMGLFVDRATTAREIRPGVEPMDLVHALVGFSYGTNTGPDCRRLHHA
jgi:AcrR family transcriptional regulator